MPFCNMVLCVVYSDVTFGTEKETSLKCLLTVKNTILVSLPLKKPNTIVCK